MSASLFTFMTLLGVGRVAKPFPTFAHHVSTVSFAFRGVLWAWRHRMQITCAVRAPGDLRAICAYQHARENAIFIFFKIRWKYLSWVLAHANTCA